MEANLKVKSFDEEIEKESPSGICDWSTLTVTVCMSVGEFIAFWIFGWHWFPWEIVICGSISGSVGAVISLWIRSRKESD